MPADWTRLQSQTIDWLRFPMAVAVVMLHYSKTVFVQAEGPLRFLCILFQEGICRLAVPCFFLISGYLFFSQLEQKWDWGIWKGKMVKRARTLLLPYILWNLIAFLAYWLYARAAGDGSSLAQAFGRSGGIRMFWSVTGGIPIGSQAYPVNGPLWFIRDLILFILLTPLVYQFVKWTRFYGILALCLVHLAVNRVVPEGFLFFATGACFRITGKNIVQTLWRRKGLLFALALLSLTGLVLVQWYADSAFWKKMIKFVFLVSGIAASFCGAASLLEKGRFRVVPFLAGSSFFIFAAHEVLLLQDVATPAVHYVLPEGMFWECLAFFLVPALTVGLCLGLLLVMQKLLPRTTSVLTGNRRMSVAYNS
jgi:surface polysaccharide O-acyltransferase-like enzyme